ncbi:PQQ-binding-like beta-propeller repeat protein [Phycisphaeraceae bacterium D3-23]
MPSRKTSFHHRRASMCCLMLLPALLLAAAQAAAQWPQYLGPTGDAVSPETGLLEAWPEAGPPEAWQIELGPGFGGAAVHNGQVFLLDREHGESDVLRVLDLATGEELWRHSYEAMGRVGYEGSRSTPAVTEQHVFTTGEFGHLHAFNRATRDVAWSVNLMEAYPGEREPEEEGGGRRRGRGGGRGGDNGQNWGYGTNPLLVDDLVVVVSPPANTPGLVAYDQLTGEVAWESEPFGCGNWYVSPLLKTIADTRGIAIRTDVELFFIDPDNGETLFRTPVFERGMIPIPPVTVLPDGERVFVTSGYEAGSVMLNVTRDADGGFQVEEVYRTVEGSQIHPGIAIDGHLYINHTENSNSRGARQRYAGLACVDLATGEVKWNTGDDPFVGRGAILYVDGKLILQDAEGGKLFLIEPSPEGFRPISSFQAVDAQQRQAWAPLAIADGRLLVRDQSGMKCFSLREDR